jgi:hypothetical protein
MSLDTVKPDWSEKKRSKNENARETCPVACVKRKEKSGVNHEKARSETKSYGSFQECKMFVFAGDNVTNVFVQKHTLAPLFDE